MGGNPQRGQSITELLTLLQIPLCVTAGPPEEGDLSLHRPALVDPAHNLDRKEDPRGARPKVVPRLAPRRSLRRPKDFREGQIFTCP